MGRLSEILHKKDKLRDNPVAYADTVNRIAVPPVPDVLFIRSDTFTHEVIEPPAGPPDAEHSGAAGGEEDANFLTARDTSSVTSRTRRSLDVFRPSGGRPRSRSSASATSSLASTNTAGEARRGLRERLHLGHGSRTPSSEAVPFDLPAIVATAADADNSEGQAQWIKRATLLVAAPGPDESAGGARARSDSRPGTPTQALADMRLVMEAEKERTTEANGVVSSQQIDADIQEAIRLHDADRLEQSTGLFGRLADPHGANNPLSQVLYGLALRHGWGCQPNPELAHNYISLSASNAAAIERRALAAGEPGGAARGELILAVYELANDFRNGWGTKKDAMAAREYFETAANLGDTDAMNEIAWCYLEGFGGKKDKFAAAQYYRLAEQKGNKTLGNSWIWKDKYNPENAKKKK